jgi:hypothetical protein
MLRKATFLFAVLTLGECKVPSADDSLVLVQKHIRKDNLTPTLPPFPDTNQFPEFRDAGEISRRVSKPKSRVAAACSSAALTVLVDYFFYKHVTSIGFASKDEFMHPKVPVIFDFCMMAGAIMTAILASMGTGYGYLNSNGELINSDWSSPVVQTFFGAFVGMRALTNAFYIIKMNSDGEGSEIRTQVQNLWQYAKVIHDNPDQYFTGGCPGEERNGCAHEKYNKSYKVKDSDGQYRKAVKGKEDIYAILLNKAMKQDPASGKQIMEESATRAESWRLHNVVPAYFAMIVAALAGAVEGHTKKNRFIWNTYGERVAYYLRTYYSRSQESLLQTSDASTAGQGKLARVAERAEAILARIETLSQKVGRSNILSRVSSKIDSGLLDEHDLNVVNDISDKLGTQNSSSPVKAGLLQVDSSAELSEYFSKLKSTMTEKDGRFRPDLLQAAKHLLKGHESEMEELVATLDADPGQEQLEDAFFGIATARMDEWEKALERRP